MVQAQTFTVNGREMNLEQAQAYYASQKPTKAPVSDVKVKDEVIPPLGDTPLEKPSKEDLQKECIAKGIKFHPATGAAKLAALLQKAEKGV